VVPTKVGYLSDDKWACLQHWVLTVDRPRSLFISLVHPFDGSEGGSACAHCNWFKEIIAVVQPPEKCSHGFFERPLPFQSSEIANVVLRRFQVQSTCII